MFRPGRNAASCAIYVILFVHWRIIHFNDVGFKFQTSEQLEQSPDLSHDETYCKSHYNGKQRGDGGPFLAAGFFVNRVNRR